MRNPFDYFDDIRCVNLDGATDRWRAMARRLRALGIAGRVRRMPAVETPGNHHVGCSLSHRRAIAEAAARDCETLLLLEDDAIFLDRTLPILGDAVDALARTDWTLCYLGGTRWTEAETPVAGASHLVHAGHRTSFHAVAIHRRAFASLLAALPDDVPTMTDWVARFGAVDQPWGYLPADILARAVAVSPSVASQPVLLPWEDPADQCRFTLGQSNLHADALRLSPRQQLFIFEEGEALLYSEIHGWFRLSDPHWIYLLCALEAGTGGGALAAQLAQRAGLTDAQARETLSRFAAFGLDAGFLCDPDAPPAAEVTPPEPPPRGKPPRIDPDAGGWTARDYRFCGVPIRMRSNDAALMAALGAELAAFEVPVEDGARHEIIVLAIQAHRYLFCDGDYALFDAPLAEMHACLRDVFTRLALGGPGTMLGLRAAVIDCKGVQILLPGLADEAILLALEAQGATLRTRDLVVVMRADGALCGVSFGGLPEGAARRAHASLPAVERVVLARLGSGVGVRRLATAEGIVELLAHRLPGARGLTTHDAAMLVERFEALPCIEVVAPDAEALAREIVRS